MDIPYPLAQIGGRLRLQDGCLMIDQDVVFWPAETTWNRDAQEVVFGGDFEGASNAPVDSTFTGAGGIWDVEDDLGVLRNNDEGALRDCLRDTNATHAVLAHPDAR